MSGVGARLELEWNGAEFVPVTAGVPLEDRGFRYGLALFETLRISRGRALFARDHLLTMYGSAYAVPFLGRQSKEAFVAAERVLEDSSLLPENGIARVHLTAGNGGFHETADSPRFYLTADSRTPPGPEVYESGLRAMIYADPVPTVAPWMKTHNYWGQLTALRTARDDGFQEAVLTNPDGEVRSFCLGNLFIERKGQVLTPHLATSTCRSGVTRRWVLDELGKVAQETRLTVEDLATADGVFLTSSWYGVLPVTRLGERELPVTPRMRGLVEAFGKLL